MGTCAGCGQAYSPVKGPGVILSGHLFNITPDNPPPSHLPPLVVPEEKETTEEPTKEATKEA